MLETKEVSTPRPPIGVACTFTGRAITLTDTRGELPVSDSEMLSTDQPLPPIRVRARAQARGSEVTVCEAEPSMADPSSTSASTGVAEATPSLYMEATTGSFIAVTLYTLK